MPTYCKPSNIMDSSLCIKGAILIILCYLCYGSSLNGSFVFDDTVAIKQNKAILQVPTNYTAIFTSDFWGAPITSEDSHKSYRPLTSLLFHWEWIKWQMQPKHMKAINLAIHTINSLLVLLVLNKFKFKESHITSVSVKDIAFVGALLFAVHPIHTESVAGIVSRADLMFCFVYLICLYICCNTNKEGQQTILWFSIAISLLTFIGMLFKESAITIPMACVFLSFMLKGFHTFPWKQQIKALFCMQNILLGITTLSMTIFRLWIADFKSPKFRNADNPVAHASSLKTRILSQSYLYFYNLKILINPSELCFDWSFGCIPLIQKFNDNRLLLVLGLYVLLTIVILNYQRNCTTFVALGLITIPFLPASGIIKVGFVIAERVLYVPSIGFCYLVAYGFVCLCENEGFRKCLQIALGIVICVFVMRCRQRSAEWLTEEKLFSSALDVCPNNAKVHYNIARLATDMKNYSKAFGHYHTAIELSPDYDAALMNLGNLYRDRGDLTKAEIYLKRALEITPNFATAWMNLGIVQAAKKNFAEALQSYETALSHRKNYANCYYNMGNLYLEQKRNSKALQHWELAVALKPRLRQAWTNILTMLDSQGRFEKALKVSDEALKYLPNDSSITFLRANIYGKLGHYEQAEHLYKQVVAKEPLNYLYHTNLAVLYHRWNKITEAIDSYKKALEIEPNRATTARENLNKLINKLASKKRGA
ncbi:transmembrane O-mannosyltransferase targeting cadherins 4 [Musca autumnalis]|uniref:transmembrane O-mannosyltransferase targeting cadherins 4 n=1 Tax=Musca autumnalis TaxID=221902 RepID=UPI003CEFCF1E